MAFNFFKKKKDSASKPLAKKEARAETLKKEEVSISKSFDTSSILLSPHVTEKATRLSSNNQYVFKVFPRANKTEVKRAIENLYKVKVVGVKIIRVSGKTRRMGKSQGWKKGYKKAIIRVGQGQRIEAATI